MQCLIAHGTGAGCEFAEDEVAEAASLVVGMGAHALDFGALRACAVKGAHGYKNAIPFTNQKFSLVVEICFFDRIHIVVPGTAPQVGSSLLNGINVQIFDGLHVGRHVTAQGEHETCPLTSLSKIRNILLVLYPMAIGNYIFHQLLCHFLAAASASCVSCVRMVMQRSTSDDPA